METCWRELIKFALYKAHETWADVESHTLSDEELDKKFFVDYGLSKGVPFTLWTRNRVYFPVVHDGMEWVESVSRNPDGIPTDHIGGQ